MKRRHYDAIDAPTAAIRASIALELACRAKPWPQGYGLGRNHDNCFEMNDGDEVIAEGLKKLAKSARYRAAMLVHSGVPSAWKEYAEKICPRCGGELQIDPRCVIEESMYRYLTSDPIRRTRIARAVLCTACEFCEERSGT